MPADSEIHRLGNLHVGDPRDRGLTTVCNFVKKGNYDVHLLIGDYYGKTTQAISCFSESGVKIGIVNGNHDKCSEITEKTKLETCSYGFTSGDVVFQMIDTEKKVNDYKSAVETNFKKWQAISYYPSHNNCNA